MIELGGDLKPNLYSTNLQQTEKTSPISEKKQEEGRRRGMEREKSIVGKEMWRLSEGG